MQNINIDNDIEYIKGRKYNNFDEEDKIKLIELVDKHNIEIKDMNRNDKMNLFSMLRSFDEKIYEKYGARFVRLPYPPQSVTYHITSFCKNSCLFCAHHSLEARENYMYKLKHIVNYNEFLKYAQLLYNGYIDELKLCGTGEPLLNGQYFDMIDWIIEKFGSVSVQTDLPDAIMKKNGFKKIKEREKYIKGVNTDLNTFIDRTGEPVLRGANLDEKVKWIYSILSETDIPVSLNIILNSSNHLSAMTVLLKIIQSSPVNIRKRLYINLFPVVPYSINKFTSFESEASYFSHNVQSSLKDIISLCKKNDLPYITYSNNTKDAVCEYLWKRFQFPWPLKHLTKKEAKGNVLPVACLAAITGELTTIGNLSNITNLYQFWNSNLLVSMRRNMIHNIMPANSCIKCKYKSFRFASNNEGDPK